MGKLKKAIKSGVGRTGASMGNFQGSTQYTGRTLGQPAPEMPASTTSSVRPKRPGAKRLGGARTPLSA